MSKTYDDYMVEENNYQKRIAAADFFRSLKCELAMRSDNEHVGSGLGGNVSEFMFLITHDVDIALSSDDKIHFSGLKKITVSLPEKPNMKDLRQELTKFINSHSDKLTITNEQATNVSFLKDLPFSTIELDLLIRGLQVGQEVATWLDPKIELQSQISSVLGRESADIEKSFLKEMGLPENYFEINTESSNPYHGMLRKHPVWSKKREAVWDRKGKMCEQLLSEDDLNKLNFIGTLPAPITLFVMRTCISIDRMVVLDLDEKLQFLGDINKSIDTANE